MRQVGRRNDANLQTRSIKVLNIISSKYKSLFHSRNETHCLGILNLTSSFLSLSFFRSDFSPASKECRTRGSAVDQASPVGRRLRLRGTAACRCAYLSSHMLPLISFHRVFECRTYNFIIFMPLLKKSYSFPF